MRTLSALLLIASAFVAAPGAALAVSEIAPYEPLQGSWYPPDAPGLYIDVDIGPAGYGFIAINDFDAKGAPQTRYLQGPLQVSDGATWENTGVRARINSRVYAQEFGSCLECAYLPARVRDLNQGDAELRFLNGHAAEIVIDGRTIAIQRYPMYVAASGLLQQRLLGRWLLLARTRDADYVETVSVVPYSSTAPAPFLFAPADITLPGLDRSRLLSIQCDNCNRLNAGPHFLNGGGLLLGVHEAGKVVLYGTSATITGRVLARPSYRVLDLEGGLIQGSAIPSVLATNDGSLDPDEFAIIDFTLQKLPDDWRQP